MIAAVMMIIVGVVPALVKDRRATWTAKRSGGGGERGGVGV
jgi:hypothetical protein